jgi:hypothetical protein
MLRDVPVLVYMDGTLSHNDKPAVQKLRNRRWWMVRQIAPINIKIDVIAKITPRLANRIGGRVTV